MYPTYSLQVYSFSEKKWVDTSYEASNRPHHYQDVLYPAYCRLVEGANGGSPNQQPIGYRIMRDNSQPVDSWDNGKVPS